MSRGCVQLRGLTLTESGTQSAGPGDRGADPGTADTPGTSHTSFSSSSSWRPWTWPASTASLTWRSWTCCHHQFTRFKLTQLIFRSPLRWQMTPFLQWDKTGCNSVEIIFHGQFQDIQNKHCPGAIILFVSELSWFIYKCCKELQSCLNLVYQHLIIVTSQCSESIIILRYSQKHIFIAVQIKRWGASQRLPGEVNWYHNLHSQWNESESQRQKPSLLTQ